LRIVILGGTRFIGRAIVEELHAAGHELLVVHRGETEPDSGPEVTHLHCDRQELGGRRDELSRFQPDTAVDTRALSRKDAEVAVAALPPGIRLLVISSADVYRAFGSVHAGIVTDPVPLDELSPVRTDRFPYRDRRPGYDDYEKLDVEDVYLAHRGTVCRLPAVYGEHDYQRREEFILRRVRAGRDRVPIGSGAFLFARAYVGDVARGVRLALESDAAAGEIFNLSEARTPSIRLWAQEILEAAGSKAELVTVPEDQLPLDMGLTKAVAQPILLSAAKARSMLGWTDSDPHQTVARSVAWHLSHPPQEPEAGFEADDNALGATPGKIKPG
jgi:nucleoside-diphosphate-sugar epimerase